jgi:adenosylcobinamide kinase / adenosylcobinamide-phosphate guanylyltransferase
MNRIKKYLVIGGSGSGKSEFAQRLAAKCGEPVIYLATGQAAGPEMVWRIRKHRDSRPDEWHTVEAQRRLAQALEAAPEPAPTVLLEDIGSLVASCMPQVEEHDGEMLSPGAEMEQVAQALREEVDGFFAWCAANEKHLVIVTSEVGLGLLPMSPAGRLYKDALGGINQELASQVDRTFLVVAGLAVDLQVASRDVFADLGLE